MFIYNVTINIADDVHYQWLKWMQDEHIAEVMKTGCFLDNNMLKVLYVEDEGHTYSIQYRFLEMSDYENYRDNFAPKLQAEIKKYFEGKYVAFRTILQVVEK